MPPKKRDRSYKGKVNPDLVLARQDAFLVAYGEAGTLRAACDAADVGRSTITDWNRSDAHGFKAKYATAKELFREHLQDLAFGRVQQQKPNDNPVLLITLLNAHWPEKYRRDGNVVTNEVKEMMVEWKKWVRDNRSSPKNQPAINEAEEARRNAVDEVERLLTRKRDNDDAD